MQPSQLRRFIWVLALIAASLVAWVAARSSAGQGDNSYAVLDDDLEPFRSAFNAASDQARAVLLVGPT